MASKGYIAFDLGAESGRAMLARLDDGKIHLDELHRFPNSIVELPSGLHWNLTGLYGCIVEGLRKAAEAAREHDIELISAGVDTWGVDFGLVGRNGALLGLPHAYRDPRNGPAMDHAVDKLGAQTIYDATGIQLLSINTLYQVLAQHAAEPTLLERAHRLLNTPDLLHYFLTGEMTHEATICSTSQMLNPRSKKNPHTGEWAVDLLDKLGLPSHFLGPVMPAGSPVGVLREAVRNDTGLGKLKIVAPGGHDTACAVAAVPVDPNAGGSWAFLSSGTWSLMGAELDTPLINDDARQAGFTNERGVEGTIRFLKNIAGLWLVQEVRREAARRGHDHDYQTLTAMAADAPAFRTIVDPDHAPFAQPGQMPDKIDAFALATSQPKPESLGQYVRCCLESLALTYRRTMENLEALLGRRIDRLHIVGGGGRNALLNQMTADALGRPVIVGPYEGTAAGNALMQAMADGRIQGLDQLRQVIRATYSPVVFEPGAHAPDFEEQYPRYTAMLGK